MVSNLHKMHNGCKIFDLQMHHSGIDLFTSHMTDLNVLDHCVYKHVCLMMHVDLCLFIEFITAFCTLFIFDESHD